MDIGPRGRDTETGAAACRRKSGGALLIQKQTADEHVELHNSKEG
jgi:hypothetical protein